MQSITSSSYAHQTLLTVSRRSRPASETLQDIDEFFTLPLRFQTVTLPSFATSTRQKTASQTVYILFPCYILSNFLFINSCLFVVLLFCLFVYWFTYLSVRTSLSIFVFVCCFVVLFVCLLVYLSVSPYIPVYFCFCLFVCWFACLSVRISLCLFLFFVCWLSVLFVLGFSDLLWLKVFSS